jgi:hypothetical protein
MLIELHDGFLINKLKEVFLKKSDGWNRELASEIEQVIINISEQFYKDGYDLGYQRRNK